MSPAAAGIFGHDEDTGASPLAPLGLHALRLRMKPSRVIQTVRIFVFIKRRRNLFKLKREKNKGEDSSSRGRGLELG